jgi:hypothetical protein
VLIDLELRDRIAEIVEQLADHAGALLKAA